jgi:uncharacterized protein (DUF1778 family)
MVWTPDDADNEHDASEDADGLCGHSLHNDVFWRLIQPRDPPGDNVMASIVEHTPARDQAINIRASRRQRDLIDQAASTLGKSRSEFMLETACRAAEEVILNQTFFLVNQEDADRFNAILDNPPAPSDALRTLLRTKAPWE